MALEQTTGNDGPVFTEVDMGSSDSALTVRATVVQASTIFYDTPATLDKAERLLAEAASFGSQLVVFPEAFVGGYPRGSNFGVTIGSRSLKGKEDFRKYHAAAINVPGPEVDRLAAMAGKYKVYLVMGVIERDGYTLYCTILFFDNQGCYLGKHRKLMPTALERIIWGFGDGSHIPVFDTPIGKIGAAICWENKMPLLRTTMYAKDLKKKEKELKAKEGDLKRREEIVKRKEEAAARVPGQLIWEIVKRNNCFLVKEFGNNTQSVQFSKEPNNLYNLNSYKQSGWYHLRIKMCI